MEGHNAEGLSHARSHAFEDCCGSTSTVTGVGSPMSTSTIRTPGVATGSVLLVVMLIRTGLASLGIAVIFSNVSLTSVAPLTNPEIFINGRASKAKHHAL